MDGKQNSVRKNFISIFITLLGILSAGLGLEGFLIPNHFVDGGITGISMLLSNVSQISLPILIFIINFPFICMGFFKVSKSFGLKSGLAILGLILVLTLMQYPRITDDKLLASIFGGFFLGAGIGLSIRGGAVLDGTEILALILSRKTGARVGDIILVLNIVIFAFGALILGAESAMYSVLTYFSASRTIDFLLYGIEGYDGVTIISSKSAEIKDAIISQTGRGVTVYKGKGGFSGADQDIVFCVVTRLEVPRIKSIIEDIDPEAFIVMHNINDASGGMIKRKVVH